MRVSLIACATASPMVLKREHMDSLKVPNACVLGPILDNAADEDVLAGPDRKYFHKDLGPTEAGSKWGGYTNANTGHTDDNQYGCFVY